MRNEPRSQQLVRLLMLNWHESNNPCGMARSLISMLQHEYSHTHTHTDLLGRCIFSQRRSGGVEIAAILRTNKMILAYSTKTPNTQRHTTTPPHHHTRSWVHYLDISFSQWFCQFQKYASNMLLFWRRTQQWLQSFQQLCRHGNDFFKIAKQLVKGGMCA